MRTRKRTGPLVSCITIEIVVLLMCCGMAGCEKTTEKSKTSRTTESEAGKEKGDPLSGRRWHRYACGDGTFYMVKWSLRETPVEEYFASIHVFWLVNGKAVEVQCEDIFDLTADFDSDAKGGLYGQGKKHLWYFKDGKAVIVTTVSKDSISPKEYLPSRNTVMWSVLSAYGQAAYDTGYKTGHEEGSLSTELYYR